MPRQADSTSSDGHAVDQELAALDAAPYEDDPDLRWHAPPGPDLPYDGPIPDEVVQPATRRRPDDRA